MAEDMNRLNASIQMQTTYIMQMNLMFREQLSITRDMNIGLHVLSDALKQIAKQFWELGKFISDVISKFSQLSNLSTIGNLLEKNMKQASDAIDKDVAIHEKSFKTIGEKKAGIDESGESIDISKGGGLKSFLNMTLNPLRGVSTALKPLSTQFAMLGPQMAATALFMQPIQKLLEGFFSAFEPILDAFEMLGELLGLILQPITNEIALALVNLFNSMVPMLPALQEFALGIFNLLMPIFAVINRMAETGESFGSALSFVLAQALGLIVEGLVRIIPQLVDLMTAIISELIKFFPDFITSIKQDLIDVFKELGGAIFDGFLAKLSAQDLDTGMATNAETASGIEIPWWRKFLDWISGGNWW